MVLNGVIRHVSFLLIFFSSFQVLGLFYPQYFYIDELLLLILIALYSFDSIFINRKLPVDFVCLLVINALIILYLLNLIIHYYSFPAFTIKLILYVKIIIAFVMLPRIGNKMIQSRDKKKIIIFITLVAIIGISEFIFVQFISNKFLQDVFFLKYRNGIYRASSVTGHPISFAMLCLSGIIILPSLKLKMKAKIIIGTILLLGQIASGTRLALFFSFLFFLYSYKNTFNWQLLKVIVFIPIVLFFFFINNNFKRAKDGEGDAIRVVGLKYGIEALNGGEFIFGNGIGAYGTYESIENNSPLYTKINFPLHYKRLIRENKGSGIESFSIINFVETGLIGFILFYFLILYIINKRFEKRYKFFYMTLVVLVSFIYPLYTIPFLFVFLIYGSNNIYG